MPQTYEVEKILDKRIKKSSIQYLIKWRNYPKSESTWEPLENLEGCQKKIIDFEKTCGSKDNFINKKRKRESSSSSSKEVTETIRVSNSNSEEESSI